MFRSAPNKTRGGRRGIRDHDVFYGERKFPYTNYVVLYDYHDIIYGIAVYYRRCVLS